MRSVSVDSGRWPSNPQEKLSASPTRRLATPPRRCVVFEDGTQWDHPNCKRFDAPESAGEPDAPVIAVNGSADADTLVAAGSNNEFTGGKGDDF